MKNFKSLLVLLVAGALLSACGNQPKRTESYLTSSYLGYSGSQASYLSADQRCSETVNVQSNNGSSSSEFRACRGSTSNFAVQLFAVDSTVRPICVFPAISGRANPNLFQCVNTKSSGVSLTFNQVNFNAVFVVDYVNLQVMRSCAQYGDIATCAASANMPLGYGAL